MSLKFCFIGAGNLATQLSIAFRDAGFEIIQVFSQTEVSAKALADKLNSQCTTQKSALVKDADVYFIALKDSVLQEVLSGIDFNPKFVVHCSGSMPISVLDKYATNYGVMYPLQTFSKERKVDFSKIPVFIEANNPETERLLLQIGKQISERVSVLTSDKRKSLHIAAVFACNFVNHFYALAAEYLENQDIPFDVLYPLIEETAQKAREMPPKKAQTGPAVRFDENIINDHLNSLNAYPELKELYNSISKRIFDFHQKNKNGFF